MSNFAKNRSRRTPGRVNFAQNRFWRTLEGGNGPLPRCLDRAGLDPGEGPL